MNTKLTLSLKKTVIEKAKRYAKNSNQSLSQLIESYLDKITSSNPEFGDTELDSIRGVIKLPKNFKLKDEVKKIRQAKHG